jgi:uncharacterized membrane protein YuzA (DUF378 family)
MNSLNLLLKWYYRVMIVVLPALGMLLIGIHHYDLAIANFVSTLMTAWIMGWEQ